MIDNFHLYMTGLRMRAESSNEGMVYDGTPVPGFRAQPSATEQDIAHNLVYTATAFSDAFSDGDHPNADSCHKAVSSSTTCS